MPLSEVKLKSAMGRLSLTALAISSFTPSCDAFFRNLMISDTAMARVDPYCGSWRGCCACSPPQRCGNLNFESTVSVLGTLAILRARQCTIQNVNLALGLTAYYKYETRGNTGGDVEYSVFPKGLKMLSGTTDKRTWNGPWPVPEESLWGPDDTTQAALQEKALGFNCMNYAPGKNEPTFAYPWMRNKDFLDNNCPDGIRAEIVFPSCWDGENLDSDDHKSHVAFPTLIQDGVCPETHPIYLPILFYETIWNTQEFKDVSGRFVFANGDATGYGYHADFIAAWDDGVQEQVRDDSQCTGLGTSGEVDTCPVFNGKIQSQAEARQCKLTLPDEIADEQTEGFFDELPGAVKIKGDRHDPDQKATGTWSAEPNAPSTSIPETRASAEATYTDMGSTTGYYETATTPVAEAPSPTTFHTKSWQAPAGNVAAH